jgi:plastocyanin
MERALVRSAARRLAHLALAAGLAAAPLACGGSDGGDDTGGAGPPPTPTPPAPPPAQVAIEVANFTFSPRTDTVAVGGTVTWTNTDQTPHTATSAASPALWDSGTLADGESFSRQFPAAGSFGYLCTVHPNMTGTIVAR